uniref:Uncharacterized protein n=1 Tax=Timema tahoe TaxID=61484 RepID=A0A7R9FHI6_9NEOP|nr:unnamed protein product [Timema tahoe]
MKLMVFYLLVVVSAVRGRYHEPYQQQGPTYPGNTYRSGGFRYHITHNYDTSSVPLGSSDPATGDSVVYASRLRPGRHVCSQYTQVMTPTSQVDTYSKPIFKPYRKPCAENRICNGYRMVHQTSYRPAYNPQTTRQVSYNCCPGWSQISKISHGCGRPLCSSSCQNGGSCVRPDSCSCAKGFTGSSCQTVVLHNLNPALDVRRSYVGTRVLAVCSGSCQNGGSCIGPDSCECLTGYTGPTCQTVKYENPDTGIKPGIVGFARQCFTAETPWFVSYPGTFFTICWCIDRDIDAQS